MLKFKKQIQIVIGFSLKRRSDFKYLRDIYGYISPEDKIFIINSKEFIT